MRASLVPLLFLAGCQGTVRLYEGQATEVAWIEVRGNGRISAPAGPGAVAWEAVLVGFDGKPTPDPVHRVEVLPGPHTLSIRVQRFEMPWIARWEYAPGGYWDKTSEVIHEMDLRVETGVTYWLDWIPEWREDRPPGPPLVLRERK